MKQRRMRRMRRMRQMRVHRTKNRWNEQTHTHDTRENEYAIRETRLSFTDILQTFRMHLSHIYTHMHFVNVQRFIISEDE